MGSVIEATTLYGTGQAMVLGTQVVDMGVFIGIILGAVNGWIFNKLCDVKFPDAMSVYGGTRFVFLVVVISSAAIGVAACYVWPLVSAALSSLSGFIEGSGYIGLFVYGFLNRILIPTGLHHLIYMPFMYSSVGGVAEIAGQMYSGALPIYMAEIGSAASITAMDPSVKYMVFGFSKVFGSIGVVMAFISTARPEKKAATKAVLIPVLITAVVAGITEPLEFMYLFVSPLLFAVHSVLDGIFQVILVAASYCQPLNSALDIVTNAIIFSADVTHWWVVIPVGLAAIAVWFFTFRTLILKLNLKTPGREDDGEEIDLSQMNGKNLKAAEDEKKADKAKKGIESFGDINDVIAGLGGADNIGHIENCFTRLRIDLKDMSLVDEDLIKKYKNSGIVRGASNIQIIIGMKVSDVCEALTQALGGNLG
jgi:PTS system arbutin-like IIC component